jgi:hypothetical protein
MFRYLLVSSTALIVAGSVGVAAAGTRLALRRALPNDVVAASWINGKPTTVIFKSKFGQNRAGISGSLTPLADSGATFDNFNKNRNAEFLSWYGFSVSAYASSWSSYGNYYVSSGYERVAIPIVGKGRSVSTINVPVSPVRDGGNFSVALYSGKAGAPATKIVSAVADATNHSGYCCDQVVTVAIPATPLQKGTSYWIVESGILKTGSSNYVGWLGEDTDYTGDAKVLVQYHQYSSYKHIDYTSPWESPGSGNVTEPAAEVE